MLYIAEIYTKGPKGEKGWDIDNVAVMAPSLQAARAYISAVIVNFDAIINIGEASGQDLDSYPHPLTLIVKGQNRMTTGKGWNPSFLIYSESRTIVLEGENYDF